MPAYIDPDVAAIQAAMPPAPDVSLAPTDRLESARTLGTWSARQLPPRPSVFTGTTADITIPCRGGNISARIFRPRPEAALPGTVLWLHGGAFILGDLAKGDFAASEIAEVSGLTVINLDYRLAPEHPFPAAIDDAYDALVWLHEHGPSFGFDATFIACGGESAGASIAAATALLSAANDGPRIDLQFLAYPKLDHVGDYPSVAENSAGDADRAMADFFRGCYLPEGTDPRDPLVSPVFATPDQLAALPAAVILTADADTIRDEAERYAGLLAAAGIEVTCLRAVGHTHGILDFTADSVSAKRVAHAAYDVIRRSCLDRITAPSGLVQRFG